MPDIGTLYVLANADASLAKVGFTRIGTPDASADDYARQHGISWHVYWSAATINVAETEATIHRALQARRFSLMPEEREIFHCTPMLAKRIAERFVVAPDPARRPYVRSVHSAWLDRSAVASQVVAYWPAIRRLHNRLRGIARMLKHK